MTKSELNYINSKLANSFGKTPSGEGTWRIAWNPDRTEKRLGTFRDYTENGNLFIRQVTEVREVLKYPWIGDFYILERFVPFSYEQLGIYQSDGYECLFVFEKKGEQLPVLWDPLYAMINLGINGPKKTSKPSDVEEAEKEFKMMAEYFGLGDEELLAYGGGVALPGIPFDIEKSEKSENKVVNGESNISIDTPDSSE